MSKLDRRSTTLWGYQSLIHNRKKNLTYVGQNIKCKISLLADKKNLPAFKLCLINLFFFFVLKLFSYYTIDPDNNGKNLRDPLQLPDVDTVYKFVMFIYSFQIIVLCNIIVQSSILAEFPRWFSFEFSFFLQFPIRSKHFLTGLEHLDCINSIVFIIVLPSPGITWFFSALI